LRGLSPRATAAIAAVVVMVLSILSYEAYYWALQRRAVGPPSPSLISGYLGGSWSLDANRSFTATFNVTEGYISLRYLNGSLVTWPLEPYESDFELPGPGGGATGGLPALADVYFFQGPNSSELVVEVFKANETQAEQVLTALEARLGPPSAKDGVKYYVETSLAPLGESPNVHLAEVTYVYAVFRNYLVIVVSNATVPSQRLASLTVRYALSLP